MITEYVYNFSANNKAVKKVKKGETVRFKTLDCFSNQVESEDQLITSLDFNRVNPASGPVFVEGALEGDVLVVDLLEIDIADRGFIATLPGTGPLSDQSELRTKEVPVKDGHIVFNDVKLPINPMVGVIGVAPKSEDVVCGFSGAHGGNMDCNKIVKGSRLYFPVNVEGALFQLGDLHAKMGDGEIAGSGVEIPGEVEVKLDLIKDLKIEWPVLETEDMWYAIGSHDDFEKALHYASKQIQDLICKQYGWDRTDAYLYMSAAGSFEICQGCKPSDLPVAVRFGIPKIESKPGLIDYKG